MIAALIAAASLTAPPAATAYPTTRVIAHRIRARPSAAPCQAVPSLCNDRTALEVEEPRLFSDGIRRDSGKMDAYRYDARPCRIVGNMDCPKRARRQIFRLGEPLRDTLARSFHLR